MNHGSHNGQAPNQKKNSNKYKFLLITKTFLWLKHKCTLKSLENYIKNYCKVLYLTVFRLAYNSLLENRVDFLILDRSRDLTVSVTKLWTQISHLSRTLFTVLLILS